MHVDIPSDSSPGENVELLCDYELGDDVLYGIKWYRYGEEFYRFILEAKPQASVFKLQGIDVDVSTYHGCTNGCSRELLESIETPIQ